MNQNFIGNTLNLLSRENFIRYCCSDATGDEYGVTVVVDDTFIDAMISDDFLYPIVVEEKEMFSKLQIFLVDVLSRNKVENAELVSPSSYELSSGEDVRNISWGRSSSQSVSSKSKVDNQSIWQAAKLFNDFCRLLASLPVKSERDPSYMRRYYTVLPNLNYQFSECTVETLKNFELTVESLQSLRSVVGARAKDIDPLAEWFFYVQRHPFKKKDLLRGKAALAQRMYEICGLINNCLEVVTGETQKSLYYYLDKNSMVPKDNEYVKGDDTRAIQYSINQLYIWAEQNKEFVSDDLMTKVRSVEERLNDFVTRYGEQSWAQGSRELRIDSGIGYEDLDDVSKFWFDKAKENFEKTKDSVGDRKWEFVVNEEIAIVVMELLSDISSSLFSIYNDYLNKIFGDQISRLWERKNALHHTIWRDKGKEISHLSIIDQRNLLKQESEKILAEIRSWERIKEGFVMEVSRYLDFRFCTVCHERPIEAHVGERDRVNDFRINSVVCDSCKKSSKQKGVRERYKYKCLNCEEELYQYVHDNELFSAMRAKGKKDGKNVYHEQLIRVDFGNLNLIVMCGSCGNRNRYEVDYGWNE